LFVSVAKKRGLTGMVKRLSIGDRWLLRGVGGVVLLSLIFTGTKGVCYFKQAWLRKATDIVEAKGE